MAQPPLVGDELSADDEQAPEGVGDMGSGGTAPSSPWIRYTTAWAEHLQDVVSSAVAFTLIVLAGVILVWSVVDIFTQHRLGLELDATNFLDKVLLVLILVEIVHTVVLSLRAHALAAQPFIVVGLVAVIRKILFTLSSAQKLSTATLGLYIGMVAVFVASLVAIEIFGGRRRAPADPEDPSAGLH